MPKLCLAVAAILLLGVVTSCKQMDVKPDVKDDADTSEVVTKGWVQLQNYPGMASRWTFGFAANNKGYVIGGQYANVADGHIAHVYQYDPSTNKWQGLNDYPGKGMGLMAGFSVNNKVYLGTGFNYNTNLLQSDFWEYDPSNDTWTQKADFPGGKRQAILSFTINGYGYFIGGLLKTKQDVWRYTPATDQWNPMADYPGTGTAEMIGATVGNKAYVGAGTNIDNVVSDFWQYDPQLDKWVKKADIIEPLYNPVVFTDDTKIYVIGGIGENLKFRKSVLIYDTVTDHWTKAEDFKGQERSQAVGFVIGNTAYFGLGAGSKFAGGATYPVYFNDFWKFSL